ncbi:MAG: hypothetical protein BWX79_01697 [Alphaproteobacteria bacterium ADurb.Bin100]|nr:MAG: hypothetical protein BWX79_01697 [Alphaproteobacteria bacterium ADurb.Bin100]
MVAGGKHAAARVLNVPGQTEPARRHIANRDARAAGGPRRRRCAIHQRIRNHRRLRIIVNHLEAHRGAAAALHRVIAQVGCGVAGVIRPFVRVIGRHAVRDRALADFGHVFREVRAAADRPDHVDVRSALGQRHHVVAVEGQAAGGQVGCRQDRRVGAAVGHHIYPARRQRPVQRNGLRRRAAIDVNPQRIATQIHRRTRPVVDFNGFVVAQAFDVLGNEQIGGFHSPGQIVGGIGHPVAVRGNQHGLHQIVIPRRGGPVARVRGVGEHEIHAVGAGP